MGCLISGYALCAASEGKSKKAFSGSLHY